MSLPPALLARLKKRGIIGDAGESSSKIVEETQPNKSEEEVIAENYDEDEVTPVGLSNQASSSFASADAHVHSTSKPSNFKYSKKRIEPVKGCPNKVNLYHDCTEYCREKYGEGKDAPSPRTERRYRSLVKRFPLPLGWVDVWEPGLQRYYFWHTETDKVSWLPPSHPKATITESVFKMKSDLQKNNKPNSDSDSQDSDDDEDASGSDLSSDDSDSSSSSEDANDDGRGLRRKIRRANDLDPMDPASYSKECPRGKWSDGLNRRNDD